MSAAAEQHALARDVVALYVDPRGHYPRLVAECFDEARDAKTYAGDLPVVAHPPCGPWGQLHRWCTKQDASAGPHAVDVVRRVGGVLEHPACSKLWRYCLLPRPGELPDGFGGRTFAVNQVAWGHTCTKPTWLYVVGVPSAVVAAGIRTGGTATHWVSSLGKDRFKRSGAKCASAEMRRRTPEAFARWLVSLAQAVQR